jgi:hypothetical protein
LGGLVSRKAKAMNPTHVFNGYSADTEENNHPLLGIKCHIISREEDGSVCVALHTSRQTIDVCMENGLSCISWDKDLKMFVYQADEELELTDLRTLAEIKAKTWKYPKDLFTK